MFCRPWAVDRTLILLFVNAMDPGSLEVGLGETPVSKKNRDYYIFFQ
jgi:hypothetical protein